MKIIRVRDNFLECDGVTLALDHDPSDDNPPKVRHNADGTYTVAWIEHDDAAEDPLDRGSIGTGGRRDGRESNRLYQEARGLDSDWNLVRKPNPDSVLLDVYEHSGRAYRINGDTFPIFHHEAWDCVHGAGVWVPNADTLAELKGKRNRRAKLVEIARAEVQLVNAWMRGDTWVVVVQTNTASGDLLDSERQGTYYGQDEAELGLAEAIKE